MLATKGVIMVVNAATSIILARALGVHGRGVFAVAFAVSLVLVQVGTLGMSTANPYWAAREPDATLRIVSNSVYLAVILGVLLAGAGMALKVVLPSAVHGVGWVELAVAMAAVPPTLGIVYLHSVLLGEGRTVAYNLTEGILAIASLGALVIALVPLGTGVLGGLVVMVVTNVAGMAVYLVQLTRGRGALLGPDVALMRVMFRYAARVYVGTLIAYLVIRIDMVLVNAYVGTDAAGRYSVAVGLGDALYVLPTVVAVNLFPRVSRGMSRASTAEVFRSVALLFGLVCVVAIPLAKPAIHVMFGSSFAGSTTLFYLLLPGIFSLGMVTILAHDFAGRGYPLEAMLVWFAGLGVNLAINFVFLPRNGATVAPIASSVAYTLLLVLHMRLFARDVGGYGALRPRIGETIRFVRTAIRRSAPESS